MTNYIDKDRGVISDVLKNRFYPLVAIEASGNYITNIDGRKCLDMSSGWAVMNVGYGDERLAKTVYESYKKDSFASLVSGTSVESIELAEKLISIMPGDFEKKVWFGHSGSYANEFIAKMVPKLKNGKKIVTYRGSYHGQNMGAYILSGHPSLMEFGDNGYYLEFPNCYRCQFSEGKKCEGLCYKTFEEQLQKIGLDKSSIGAIEVEAFLCDGGDIPFPVEYLKYLDKYCKKNDIYLIVDEVKTGMGRSGEWFSFETAGITPDVVVIGKSLGAGVPISAVIGRKELMDVGIAQHLYTTAGSSLLCAVALENIKIIEFDNLMNNAKKQGNYLLKILNKLKKETDVIGDVRGLGLSIGIEFVRDKRKKDPAGDFVAKLVYRLFELGLICFSTGKDSNVIEWTPTLTITKAEADKAVTILKEAIADVKVGKVTDDQIAEYILGSC